MRVHIQHWIKGPYTLLSDDGSAVTKNEPVTQKWLPGDHVDADGRVLERCGTQTIIGIVNFVNRTGYGFSPRGAALYMFHPFQESYPPFLVASKTKYTENYIASVSFEHWNDKWPRGGIQRLLGPVGARDIETAALRMSVMIKGDDAVMGCCVSEADYDCSTWDRVFNIDPSGCVDVDDVFAWRVRDGVTEFAIAIADVAAMVPEGSALDDLAYERGTTFYDDGMAVVPMLPEALSTKAASLRADGVRRPVVALVYRLNDDNGEIEHVGFRRCMMTVTRAYTYESIMGDRNTCFTLIAFLMDVLGRDIDRTESHAWVEAAMVEYNRRAACVLRDARVGVMRVHNGTAVGEWNTLAAATGCREVGFFGYAAGAYVCGGTDCDVGHVGLGLDMYTHASSPLRRYADLYNQRWLVALCCGAVRPVVLRSPVVMNGRSALAKAFDRDAWFLRHLDTAGITVVDGWALVDKGNGVWSVYVPAWKRRVRGVVSEGVEVKAGTAVVVRAYTDLKAVSFGHRVVCSITASGC
jgi:hypothetical protein